ARDLAIGKIRNAGGVAETTAAGHFRIEYQLRGMGVAFPKAHGQEERASDRRRRVLDRLQTVGADVRGFETIVSLGHQRGLGVGAVPERPGFLFLLVIVLGLLLLVAVLFLSFFFLVFVFFCLV